LLATVEVGDRICSRASISQNGGTDKETKNNLFHFSSPPNFKAISIFFLWSKTPVITSLPIAPHHIS
jgi:hypothetical protein